MASGVVGMSSSKAITAPFACNVEKVYEKLKRIEFKVERIESRFIHKLSVGA